jgi:hypothetical protein
MSGKRYSHTCTAAGSEEQQKEQAQLLMYKILKILIASVS